MEIKSFEQIYRDMQNYIIAHQDRLTDFNEGGVLSSQVEAAAREIAMLYVRCRVGFSSYLRSLPYSVFGFSMKEGVKASAKVVFSRAKPFSYDTNIPAGTIVSGAGLNFITSEAGAILSGAEDSQPVQAAAQNIGDRYNISANTIKTIVSPLTADIAAVNNPIPATGGENDEDSAAYMDRFADYIIGLQRTNASGLLSALNKGRLIRSMCIEEHFPPVDGIWNMSIYLEDGSGGMSPESLSEAKRIIDGNTEKNIGGFRAPGVNIRYLTPEIIPVTTHICVSTDYDIANEVDESVIVNMVREAMQKYVNGMKIGKSVLLSDLTVLLKRFAVLDNVKITYPKDDIIIKADQIARYEDCIVTVSA